MRGCVVRSISYDFEEMNKQIFFGQYKRIDSYFLRHRARVSGLPQARSRNPRESRRRWY